MQNHGTQTATRANQCHQNSNNLKKAILEFGGFIPNGNALQEMCEMCEIRESAGYARDVLAESVVRLFFLFFCFVGPPKVSVRGHGCGKVSVRVHGTPKVSVHGTVVEK